MRLTACKRFSHCVTLTRVLFPHIIFYSDTKVPDFVVMEKARKCAHVYELIFFLHTSRSAEYYKINSCLSLLDYRDSLLELSLFTFDKQTGIAFSDIMVFDLLIRLCDNTKDVATL